MAATESTPHGAAAAPPTDRRSNSAAHEHEDVVPRAPTPKGSFLGTLLVWVIGVCVLAAVGYFAWSYYAKAKTIASGPGGRRQGAAPPVVIEKAQVGDMQLYVRSIGTVTAYNTVTVRTRIDGQIDKVAFTEGQKVHEGDLLVQIDPRPYQVQLAQAQAQLGQAQGQLAKDQATLGNDKLTLQRDQAAAESLAKQQVDTAAAAVRSDEGTVKADQAAIQAANSAIEAAKLNITYCCINAPLDGRIGLRMVDQGNWVHAADTNGLAVITQLNPIAVIFSPREDDLPRVQKAMAADSHPVAEAWDRTDEHLLATGKLEALDNQIDPTTATFKIKAVFPNLDNVLFPNEFVNVRLRLETLHGVVLAPKAAIQQNSTESNFVYVLQPDKSVQMRDVTLGPSEGEQTVIVKGVAGGDELVTAGVDKLEPGMKVTPRPPSGKDESAQGEGPASAESQPAIPSASRPAKAHSGQGRSGQGRD